MRDYRATSPHHVLQLSTNKKQWQYGGAGTTYTYTKRSPLPAIPHLQATYMPLPFFINSFFCNYCNIYCPDGGGGAGHTHNKSTVDNPAKKYTIFTGTSEPILAFNFSYLTFSVCIYLFARPARAHLCNGPR